MKKKQEYKVSIVSNDHDVNRVEKHWLGHRASQPKPAPLGAPISLGERSGTTGRTCRLQSLPQTDPNHTHALPSLPAQCPTTSPTTHPQCYPPNPMFSPSPSSLIFTTCEVGITMTVTDK